MELIRNSKVRRLVRVVTVPSLTRLCKPHRTRRPASSPRGVYVDYPPQLAPTQEAQQRQPRQGQMRKRAEIAWQSHRKTDRKSGKRERSCGIRRFGQRSSVSGSAIEKLTLLSYLRLHSSVPSAVRSARSTSSPVSSVRCPRASVLSVSLSLTRACSVHSRTTSPHRVNGETPFPARLPLPSLVYSRSVHFAMDSLPLPPNPTMQNEINPHLAVRERTIVPSEIEGSDAGSVRRWKLETCFA